MSTKVTGIARRPGTFGCRRNSSTISLRRETGGLTAQPQGNGGGHGKLTGVTGWLKARVAVKGEITLDELMAELAEAHNIDVHRATVWRVLRGLGLTDKKSPAGA
ncbi:transposase [Paracoccus ravus]|uniref:transposase n=1 Tax=Paracoccus ravus TaxID=2447760 RepID=UPI001AD963A9|nr:transposase [Paracoccus ravus]